MEEASMANDEELRAELAEERRKLEEMMARAEEDRKTLGKTRTHRETRFKLNAGTLTALERTTNRELYQPVEVKASIVTSPVGAENRMAQRNNSDQNRRAWAPATTLTYEDDVWVHEESRRHRGEREEVLSDGDRAIATLGLVATGAVIVAAAGAGVAVAAAAGAVAAGVMAAGAIATRR
jgi:hypothetical protein